MPEPANAQEIIEPVEKSAEGISEISEPATDKKEDGEEGKEETPPVVTVEDIVSGAKAKTPTGIQKRIDELTREKYQARKEAEEWKRKATTIPPPATVIAPATPIPTSERPLPPSELAFSDTEEFIKARIEYEEKLESWRQNNKKTEQNKADQEQAEKTRQQQRAEKEKVFLNAAKRVTEKYPDFYEATSTMPITDLAAEAILSSEFGPEIGYFLAKNPALNEQINTLDAIALGKAIGKLEAQFGVAKAKLTSSAPPPIEPLEGNDSLPKDPSKMSDAEWWEHEKKQKMKKIKQK